MIGTFEPQRHRDTEETGNKQNPCLFFSLPPCLCGSKFVFALAALLFAAILPSAAEESGVYARAKALYEGNGVAQDRKAAFDLFKQAADEGDAECAAAVGYIYDSGGAGVKNPALALAYLRKAAQGGSVKARYNLALVLRRSPAKPESLDEAIYWLDKAAEGGFEQAQARLGEIYFFGEDRAPRNYQTAKYYLEKSAEHGNAQSCHLLGLIYLNGLDTPRDPEKAVSRLTKAARQGHAKAQAILGGALATAKNGVKKDYVQGLFWLRLSAGQDEAMGANALGELQMAADEKTLAEVEKAVAQWHKDQSSVPGAK